MENTEDSEGSQNPVSCKMLSEIEQYYRAILEVTTDGFWIVDLNGRIVDVNEAYCRISGYSRQEIMQLHAWDLDADEDSAAVHARIKNIINNGSEVFETRHRKKNGQFFDIEISVAFLNVQGGQLISFGRDISGRKQTERDLLKNEASLKMAQHISHIGNWELDLVNDALTWSDEIFRIFEIDPQKFKATYEAFVDCIHPEDREMVNKAYLLSLANKAPYSVEHRLQMPDGRIKYVHEFCETEFAADGKPLISRGTVQDLTELQRVEEALQESEMRLRTISDNLPDGMVYEIDCGERGESRKFSFISAGVLKLHGLTQAEAIDDASLIYGQFYEADRELIAKKEQEALEKMEIFRCEARIVMPSGAIRWSVFCSAPHLRSDNHVIWQGIEFDITQQKIAQQETRDLENRLFQIQKLESLSILAGGIAHDFNNLFAGIFGNIDLAREFCSEEKVAVFLSNAMQTIDRAKGLTQQLLTFSKGGTPVKKTASLVPCIRETAQFALTGSNIACSFKFPENLRPCNFDPVQIGQVIENIVINARQSMPDGGTLEINAENIVVGAAERKPLGHGDYVKISIRDSGPGMAKEVLEKIFDPFYTTKPRGHGLGLAISHSIISQHHGCIEVESECGIGSTFHIFLPAATARSIPASEAVSEIPHTGNGTILVMDDEEILRETVGMMLQSLGYSVVCKENVDKTITFFAEEVKAGRKITCMLFDLTIQGGPGGKEAIQEVRKLCKETPVFVASGYADDPIMANPREYGFNGSICKPFRRSDLENLLNSHLSRR